MKAPFLLALAVACASVSAAPRERLSLDKGWRFHLGSAAGAERDFGFGKTAWFSKAGEAGGPASLAFDDGAWRAVNVPHDWAVELPFAPNGNGDVVSHGSKPVGRLFPETTIGWYRRTFDVPASDAGRRIRLDFDGVFRDSAVWFNGHFLGGETSGYSPFGFDVTDLVNYGGRNVVTLRADASQYEGWFYEGAGIYRHTWLTKTDAVHIPEGGTYVTSEVGKDAATLNIETEVRNDSDTPASVTVESVVMGPDGGEAAKAGARSVRVAPWETAVVRQTARVAVPALWSPETPSMYRLSSRLRSGGRVADELATPFGIRTIRFDPNKGFFLNGRRVEIKGTCNHQDHAGLGAALPDAVQDFRVRRLKAMGSNAYRSSHNAPTPELLDACDRLGMMVMDEHRLMGSSPEILADLRKMIRRDRNHPSVILWSLGNEEGTLNNAPAGTRIAETMKRAVKALDATRPVTYAGNNGAGWDGINEVMDVRGVNYSNTTEIDRYHREHPEQPVMGSEVASAIGTRGEYADDPARSFVNSNGDRAVPWGDTAEKWWTDYASRPWWAGGFVWTGFDYRGEPTPYGWPAISSQFGILDTCGFPKDDFYYYQAWWQDKPMAHILPHWNWPGREGQPVDVRVYSNADAVELFLNGRSLGRKAMPRNGHLAWQVPYAPGTLEARGTRDGQVIASDRVETTGPPAALRLTPDRATINADGEDVAMVTVAVVDAEGRVVPTASNHVIFEVGRNARILGVGNGDPASHEPDTFVATPVARAVEGWKQKPVEGTENRPETAALFDDSGWRTVADGALGNSMPANSAAVYRASVDLSAEDAARLPTLSAQVDDLGWVYVNGIRVGETTDWARTYRLDVSAALKPGLNTIAVVARNNDGASGLGPSIAFTGTIPAPQPARSAFNGLCQVIVQSGTVPGDITLTARADGLAPATLTISAAAAKARPSVP
jgi:beta-galactosidase